MSVGKYFVKMASRLVVILCLLGIGLAGDLIILKNGHLIDGTGGSVRENQVIVIRGNKIEKVSSQPFMETGGKVIDLEGRYILPGLIDSHTHMDSPEAAKRALKSGVTAARVLGSPYFRSLGTRDLIRKGYLEGPEMLVSGGIIRPDLGAPFLVTLPEYGRYLSEDLHGAENVRAIVKTLLEKGVDVIKVGASGKAGSANTDPRQPELNTEEIKAAVAEAAKYGKRVAAHAHGRTGAAQAVAAGVFSIEHGTHLNGRILDEMKEKGTYLIPTLAVMSPRADPMGDSSDAIDLRRRFWHMYSSLQDVVKTAYKKGIPMAASTDGSYEDYEDTGRIRIPHDLEDMIACGITPMDAILSATRNGARVLGIQDRTGQIIEGMEADIIVVDGNPLEDIRTLFDPLVVINNGNIVVERLY
jgi:imidazolonepropionase-like amidohydrolase